RTDLTKIVEDDPCSKINRRENQVISLVALLELARLKKVTIIQNEAFQEIYVKVTKSIKDLDVNLVENFENDVDESTNPI
ncbi:segregation/condensation protein A, partial [Bacteriovoracaceae bacterium]|nr:segregation/condensation protein A [Bacteriovoracaceae bacterium]